MVKRLNADESSRRTSVWSDDEEGERGRPLFKARTPLRKIVVMVDFELLVDVERIDPENLEPRQILTGLLAHPLVQLFRYADDGPPSTLEALEFPGSPFASETKVYEGWAILEDQEARRGAWTVVHPTDGGFAVSGVIGNAPDIAASDVASGVYADESADASREHRRRDAIASEVAAQGLGADLYITERPYLHERASRRRGVAICTATEALALLGLYLRAQGEFFVADKFRFNRGLFYWVGTRELLPEAWRWFTACVQQSHGTGDDSMLMLGGSLLARVDRALEERDAVLIALNQPQNNDVQDDALTHLDNILVNLMGAMDVAARVAHRVLGLPEADEYGAGWQKAKKGGWLEKVASKAPDLAKAVSPGTPSSNALSILRLLRNSVHGAALSGLAFHESGTAVQSLVGLPRDQEEALLLAMDALGGRDDWGVRSILPGRTFVDPAILLDRLFEYVVPLLNELMQETPVELLPHVHLSADDRLPPSAGDSTDPFAPWIRQSIRWQLGL